MVGALADWFAVTALFKHPLGIPIPHTAIIKRKKDQLGEGLGAFVRENFMSPEVVETKLRDAQVAGRLGKWLAEPVNPPGVVFAGEQPALEVAGQPIGPVRCLLERRHALPRRVFHPPVVVNVAEQQIAALLPPDRSFGGSECAAEAIGELLDGFGRRDDRVQPLLQLLDPLGSLRPDAASSAGDGKDTCRPAIPSSCRRVMSFRAGMWFLL